MIKNIVNTLALCSVILLGAFNVEAATSKKKKLGDQTTSTTEIATSTTASKAAQKSVKPKNSTTAEPGTAKKSTATKKTTSKTKLPLTATEKIANIIEDIGAEVISKIDKATGSDIKQIVQAAVTAPLKSSKVTTKTASNKSTKTAKTTKTLTSNIPAIPVIVANSSPIPVLDYATILSKVVDQSVKDAISKERQTTKQASSQGAEKTSSAKPTPTKKATKAKSTKAKKPKKTTVKKVTTSDVNQLSGDFKSFDPDFKTLSFLDEDGVAKDIKIEKTTVFLIKSKGYINPDLSDSIVDIVTNKSDGKLKQVTFTPKRPKKVTKKSTKDILAVQPATQTTHQLQPQVTSDQSLDVTGSAASDDYAFVEEEVFVE